MTPVPNLQQRSRWHLAIAAVASLLVFGICVRWAMVDVSLPPPPVLGKADVAPSTKGDLLAADHWNIDLWRPLVDAPVVVAQAPPPPTVRLFSILNRNGARVVALDLGGTEGLVYLKAGESSGAVNVVAIEATGVKITINSQPQRLELGK
jgi:hypothetical protein